jgi:dipeptidyl aminopeptidase/acylaminoacyl peptidase
MKSFLFALIALFVSCAFCLSVSAQNHTIQQYLNIRSAGSPSLSNDGKRLLYLTNVSGTTQIWAIDLPNGQPKQITNYEDNVGFVQRSPDGNGVLFGKARGGDENTQFFWMREDGSNVRQLTDALQVRHNFGEWSKDGKRIYYTSNKRDRNWFDVYAMDVSSGKEEMLLQHDGSNSVAAVSDDGSKIIVSRSSVRFSLDNDLYLLDTKTKTATHLTLHDQATQYSDVHFTPGGNSIVLGTNQNGEFIALSKMDLASRKMESIGKASWDLDATAFSPDDKMFAYTVNREGFSELYVALAASMNKELPVQLPAQGIVGGLDFSKDGTKLAFSFVSAKNNSDVWLYDLASKKLTQITKSDRAGIEQSSFVEPQLIKFTSFDRREIPAWFYKPRQINLSVTPIASETRNVAVGNKNFPVIISVHGGPEGQERPGFNPLYQYYLSRGYAVLATNVRGSTGYGKTFAALDNVEKREDSVKDLAAAVEWLKLASGADPKRIAVMGGSYGGYMTMAAITLYPELFAAAVNTVGIVNWETFLKNTSGYRRRQREVEYGMLDKDIEFLRRISPMAKVDRIKTPLFVIHGKNDPRVPYTEAEQVVAALKRRGATVEYKLFDDEGHGVSKLKNRLELYPLVADFLDKYMK